MKHLLVTNDFPPQVGGIESYLWELWRRLPADEVCVLAPAHPQAAAWDGTQAFRVERTSEKVLLPTPALRRRIDELTEETGAEVVVLDPALPLGLLGPRLRRPYALVLHGAEVTVPGRLPGSREVLRRVLRGAAHVVAAGGYPLAEAERAAGCTLPATVIPPGVDIGRFHPLTDTARHAARLRLGLDPDATVVLGVSRLVPRKGFDVAIEAVGRLAADRPDLVLVIAGSGRDRSRLERAARASRAPVRFLGRVPDGDLADLYGCADVFVMLCHNRWAGLEQEGFGIVFVEAAATGVPAVAGWSGGAHEAVVPGVTGEVVEHPRDVAAAAAAIARLVDDPALRGVRGRAARERVARELSYDVLAAHLAGALDSIRPLDGDTR